MWVLCDHDGLEVASSREVRRFAQGHGASFMGQPRGLLIFSPQDREMGGPPRFGVVGRA